MSTSTCPPVRIQRKRTRGFNLQAASPNGLPVVYVGRPTRFGNPANWQDWLEDWRDSMGGDDGAGYREFWCRDRAKEAFEIALREGSLPEVTAHIHELRGKNLACFCPEGEPCHADVLLELANHEPQVLADLNAIATPDVLAAAHGWEQLSAMGVSEATIAQARHEGRTGLGASEETAHRARCEVEAARARREAASIPC